MTINGRAAVAPCGHTGETIIGSYVRCLMGCEGAPVMPKRGVPGHVVNCACAVCKIRRQAHWIALRDKNGKDFWRIGWDGACQTLSLTCPATASIKAYNLLDADLKVIAKGMISVFIEPGPVSIDTVKLVNACVNNTVCPGDALYQSMETLMDAAVARMSGTLWGAPAPKAPTPGFATPAPATPAPHKPGTIIINGSVYKGVVVKGP